MCGTEDYLDGEGTRFSRCGVISHTLGAGESVRQVPLPEAACSGDVAKFPASKAAHHRGGLGFAFRFSIRRGVSCSPDSLFAFGFRFGIRQGNGCR